MFVKLLLTTLLSIQALSAAELSNPSSVTIETPVIFKNDPRLTPLVQGFSPAIVGIQATPDVKMALRAKQDKFINHLILLDQLQLEANKIIALLELPNETRFKPELEMIQQVIPILQQGNLLALQGRDFNLSEVARQALNNKFIDHKQAHAQMLDMLADPQQITSPTLRLYLDLDRLKEKYDQIRGLGLTTEQSATKYYNGLFLIVTSFIDALAAFKNPEILDRHNLIARLQENANTVDQENAKLSPMILDLKLALKKVSNSDSAYISLQAIEDYLAQQASV